MKALMLLHPGVEEIEASVPFTIFRYAAIDIEMVSTTENLIVQGSRNVTFQVSKRLKEIFVKDYDCLIIPGGPGIFELRENKLVIEFVQEFYRSKKLIGAICAAPIILNDAGILRGHRYTSFESTVSLLPDRIDGQDVVEDGNIITARGPGASFVFASALVIRLLGEKRAKDVAKVYYFMPKSFGV